MRRKIQYITSIELYPEIDKTIEEDENDAFEKFKKEYPNAYNPKEEYTVVYNDDRCNYNIYKLL